MGAMDLNAKDAPCMGMVTEQENTRYVRCSIHWDRIRHGANCLSKENKMNEQEQDIVRTLRHVYEYHGIIADPEDATTLTDIGRLIDRWK